MPNNREIYQCTQVLIDKYGDDGSIDHCDTSWKPASWNQFSPDRKEARPNAHLAAYKGWMHADGYTGFNDLNRSGNVHEVAFTFIG